MTLLISGGSIIDGTGGPRRSADLLVADGLIVAMDEAAATTDAERIDASSCVVAPGFIDLHSHADLSIDAFPDALCSVSQGITTAVVGNCGLTAFPLEAERREDLAAYLGPFMPSSSKIDQADWRDLQGFAREVTRAGIGVNLAPLVGQGSVRLAVMGFAPRPSSPSELVRMRSMVDLALDQGAWGLSMGLLYPPGSYSPRDELVALARRVARRDRVLAVHIRNEGDELITAVKEALEIARRAGVRLQISHHKAVGRRNWGVVSRTLEAIEAARRDGLDVGLDLWPYTSGSTTITALLPQWMLEGGRQASLERLRSPELRHRARREISRGDMEGEALLSAVGFEGIVIAECSSRRSLEGRSVADLTGGDESDDRAWDAFFDLLGEIGLEATMIIRDELSDDDVRALIRSPLSQIGSDSWLTSPEAGGRPHPRAYGAMTRYLGRYVLNEGLLTLEEGVHRITGAAAARLGLRDRGELSVGSAADIVVFDPEKIGERATFERPHAFSAGVRHVVIGGELVIRDGAPTGVRPGRVLRPVL